ncbi:MAG: hypothetical protein LBJ84_06810, partial [Oscillospiraceae bacterium]|nr:hypothetical protein [Oscillospiraceae bacterium]
MKLKIVSLLTAVAMLVSFALPAIAAPPDDAGLAPAADVPAAEPEPAVELPEEAPDVGEYADNEPPEEIEPTPEPEPAAEAEPEPEADVAIMSSELMLMAAAPAISGSGTQASPYLITTEEELTAIALGTLSNALSSYYQLQNDIALTAETWAPITPFTGVFDGNGYEISGIVLSNYSKTNAGMFG